MKLELYDNVRLKAEIEELSVRGIHKGCLGTIAKMGTEKSMIVFYNCADEGDYAFAWVKNVHLEFFGKMEAELAKEFSERVSKLDPAKKLSFEQSNLQEYDTVELIVERTTYAKQGAHKGMIGTILESKKLNGCWLVYFSDDSGADIVGIPIKEKDLKLVHRSER